MAELTVKVAVLGGAAVAMTVRPSDSSGASSPRCSDTSRRFLLRWFIPSVLFLSSPRLSLSISPADIPLFFVFLSFGRLSLYPVGFSLSVSLLFLQNKNTSSSPSLSSFFPPPFVLHSLCIYRQRE